MTERFVLVHEATGDEYVFSSRSEYVNVKAQGGYRDKDEESPAPQQQRTQVTPVPARQSEPAPADRPVKPEPPHA